VIFSWRCSDAFQIQSWIIFSQPLLNGVTHDAAELQPGTGRDFQETFILNNPQ
jgi:hypothetical protein